MSKIIMITEEQFKRLFEDCGDSEFLDGKDNTSRFSSEVSTQQIVHGKDGREKISQPTQTDTISKKLTPQQWGSLSGRKFSYQ